jgi:hypothetical protein
VDIVRQTYDLLLQQLAGRVFPADPVVSLAGLRVALEDMVAVGELPAPPPPPEKYVDGRYLERAKQS